jgi:excisionase family DNA binding protein
MTANGPRSERVVVVLGETTEDLTDSLRAAGLAPVAEEHGLAIWGPPARTAPMVAPCRAEPPRLLVTIPDAALTLRLGRSTVYELIGRRQLEVVHVGRSARIPADAVRALVQRLRADEDASRTGRVP